jgi:outer membrane protein assembly factor BamB
MKSGENYRMFGHVVDESNHEGIGGLTVEAWDGERFFSRTSTDDNGHFGFSFDKVTIKAWFKDRAPTFSIKLLKGGKEVADSQTWNSADQRLNFKVEGISAPQPVIFPVDSSSAAVRNLRLKPAAHPMPRGTIGTIGKPVAIEGPEEFPQVLLRLPYSSGLAKGIDPTTAKVFRWDQMQGAFRPVWNSGVNVQAGFAWAKIHRPGTYVVIGLPSDKLLLSTLAALAYQRRCNDLDTPAARAEVTKEAFKPLVEPSVEAVDQIRQLVLKLESNTSAALSEKDVQRGRAGYVKDVTLPHGMSLEELRKHLTSLETPPGGLPEEVLFYPPEIPASEVSAVLRPGSTADNLSGAIETLDIWKWIDLHWYWPWLFSQDWWMYQANERHSGHAAGWSDIRSTNAHRMTLLPPTTVAGPVYTKPSIVDGKIYVGTTEQGSTGGTLFKIDLATGNIDGQFATPTLAANYPIRGIGGSPAIVDDLVYFTSIHGRVYCVDTTTMSNASPPPAALWITDLKNADAHQPPGMRRNQPVDNPDADCWSGPLVVDGNVYVGCGEGETPDACGFVYCLDAATGNVKWLFCTNQFSPGVDNQPNVVPQSLIPPAGLLPGFTAHADPPVRGASVWSSLAFCEVLNRVYVGTGNPSPDTSGAQPKYSSGCVSLDASTGQCKGFWSPDPSEAYWPGDADIDIPGGPIVYSEAGQWRVAIGSKSGAFVILDADTMNEKARRQVLPRRNGDGTAANPGTPLASVVRVPSTWDSENHFGVYGTPARSGKRLFVSMGSDGGITSGLDGPGDTNPNKTPFLKVMDSKNLTDQWPTTTDAFGVTRYSNVSPPMYQTSETGLGSAAVVNDVVFACTGLSASIYAFDANTGNPLWHDNTPSSDFCLGAAIYGNYVVIGAGNCVRRYVLRPICIPWWILQTPIFVPGIGPRSISIPASIVARGGPVLGGGQGGQVIG